MFSSLYSTLVSMGDGNWLVLTLEIVESVVLDLEIESVDPA